MKQVKEVSAIDQLTTLINFLSGMGYDTSNLTIEDAFNLKRGMLEIVENIELKDPVI
jgi:hypothetical protein